MLHLKSDKIPLASESKKNQFYWTEMPTSIHTTRLLKVEKCVAPWGHMTEMFSCF